MLVQLRTTIKDMYPGYYDLAAGGVVAAGESYEENAEREAEEELGIRDTALEPKLDFYYEDEGNRCFGRVFTCVHEGPFTLQAEEVESVAFHTVEEIAAGDVAPVTPDSRLAFDRLLALGEATGAPELKGPVARRGVPARIDSMVATDFGVPCDTRRSPVPTTPNRPPRRSSTASPWERPGRTGRA